MKDKYIDTLNTLDSIETYRKEINEACDKRAKYINSLNKACEISEKSFGYIKECFENFAPVLFESSEGRKLIKRYTNTIKESEELNKLHSIYESIRKTSKDSDIDFLINGIISENINVKNDLLVKDKKILGDILAEAYLYLGDKANELLPEENSSLDNAIKFITENKKTIKNMSSYSSAVKVIREEIEKHDFKNITESKDIDSVANELMKRFNEKYGNELTEEEKTVVKELSESNNKEEVFNKYKEVCANKINEAKENYQKTGDIDSANKLTSIMEQVSKKVYVEETVENDICNFIEITSIF